MLTDDEIKAIEGEGYLDGPVPALLADRQELVTLTRELASTRQDGDLWRHLMARCRAAGLLEGE